MSTNKEVQILERLFRSLTDDNATEKLSTSITDLFVRINQENGEVALYGDDDELIVSTVIFSWVGKESKYFEQASRKLREAIDRLDNEGFWEHELFERPFSIELVTEGFETIEELLFVDDELVKITTPLLENLDEELSMFIDKLLAN